MRDAEEVAREWLQQFDDLTGVVALGDIAALLRERDAEHEAGRRGDGWVPVSERLPENGERVLIFWQGGVHFARWVPTRGGFRQPYAANPFQGVKHWQPLPAPPAEPAPPHTENRAMSLKVGDIIRLRHFQHHFDNGETSGHVNYKADKKRQFVAVLLGVEARDGSDPLDVNEALQSLGWRPPVEAEPAPPEETTP